MCPRRGSRSVDYNQGRWPGMAGAAGGHYEQRAARGRGARGGGGSWRAGGAGRGGRPAPLNLLVEQGDDVTAHCPADESSAIRTSLKKKSLCDSPASILQGRNLRMRLDNLKPDREARVATRQARSESLAGGTQRQLDVGAPVWYREYRSVDKWVAGTIVDKLGNTDYRVRSIFGTEIHRHIDQLRLRFTGAVEGTSSDRQASLDLRQVEKTRCSRKSLTFPIASGEETEGDVSAAPGSPPVEVATSPQTSSSYQPNVPENIDVCTGDSGYPQRPWLMTPITNAVEGSPEAKYNSIHGKARV
ncbi:unnamed protein product [Plutella xylostella]|uniref:(diamondback moth) hypothetical protein n=1 Tax=Plutella xylostella TaxID=51655 RepID=A0A8S4FKF0_PLUXY|nr:unnamed protein product [Plutella xylostella]